MMSTNTATDLAAVNRQNAQKSTGPRTEAGKQRSALNAFKHGLCGHTIVLAMEDREDFLGLHRKFNLELDPKGLQEQLLVEGLADGHWRLNRSRAIEANQSALDIVEKADRYITARQEATDAIAMAAGSRGRSVSMNHLSMLQERLERQLTRKLKELRQMQAERKAQEEEKMKEATLLYQLHQDEIAEALKKNPDYIPTPYDPAKDGFVLTLSEIESNIRRNARLEKARKANLRR